MASGVTTSRGNTGYGYGVLAGIASAAILAFALLHSGSPLVLIVYLTTVPLFMAALGAGLASGLTAVVVATAALFALAPAAFGLFFAVTYAVPTAGLMFIAMRHRVAANGEIEWLAEGHILAALAIYPCLLFIGVFVATMHTDGGLLAITQTAFDGMTDKLLDLFAKNGEATTPELTVSVHQYLTLLARFVPALGMCAWLFSTMMAMGAAQMILRARKWNLRCDFSLEQLHVPSWVIFAAAITGVAAFIAPAPFDYIGLNIAVVLGVPFFFVGLAVMHALAARTQSPTLVLVVFYIVISIVVYFVLLVAMVGAVDQWADFRKRLAGRP